MLYGCIVASGASRNVSDELLSIQAVKRIVNYIKNSPLKDRLFQICVMV
jgi:hypothetical protein